MIVMPFTLNRQLPPAAGSMAVLAIAVVFGAMSELFLADILVYPMQWIDTVIYELEMMLASLMYLVGFYDEVPWPYPQSYAGGLGVGVFGAILYIALEVLYVIGVVFFLARQARQSSVSTQYKTPKKLISLFLVLSLLHTFSFFYLGMFVTGVASSYGMVFSMILDADSFQNFILLAMPWKLALFVPFQLALLAGLWADQSWFKRAFMAYLVLDLLYYTVFTFVTPQGYSITAGFIVSLLALLVFLPYLLKKKMYRIETEGADAA